MNREAVKTALRYLLGRGIGRQVTVFPDDLFIVSYPKSGNTWMRFLVAHAMSGRGDETIRFDTIGARIADIHLYREGELLRRARPRILKSHEYFDPRYGSVAYIVRDPRDVVVSYYHHFIKQRAIPADYGLVSFVKRFVGNVGDGYGTWAENVGSWLGAREGHREFLLVRYEDMTAAPGVALERVLNHFGIQCDRDLIGHAVEMSSFERLSRIETASNEYWKRVGHTAGGGRFMRRGEAGAWRDELPAEAAALIERSWGDMMVRLGYIPEAR